MELQVLGSSSSGNCYLLKGEKETLILEAGIRFMNVKKALDFDLSNIVGCLVSHVHGDHSKYVNDFLNSCIPVYSSAGTIGALKIKGHRKPEVLIAEHMYQIGEFKVIPFPTKHDCPEPFGYFINHPECGNVLFATDTRFIPCKFDGLNNILIECNYRLDILDSNVAAGTVHQFLRDRTIKSHMSYYTTKETLLSNDISKVNNIVLIHLSDRNSNAKEFVDGIHKATRATVFAAEKGMIIPFDKTPF